MPVIHTCNLPNQVYTSVEQRQLLFRGEDMPL
uniref:Uncharacterized protein n=1 Tax=Anguilla anguilla TaxID=7936 RepID=A0A0E9RRV5_ANGAN